MPPLENPPPSNKNTEEPERSRLEELFDIPRSLTQATPAVPREEQGVEKGSPTDSTDKQSNPFDLPDLYNKFKDTVAGPPAPLPSGFAPAGELLPGKDVKDKTPAEKQDPLAAEKQEQPAAEKQEQPVAEKQEQPVAEKQEQPVAEKQEQPVAEKQEQPAAEKPESAAEKPETAAEKQETDPTILEAVKPAAEALKVPGGLHRGAVGETIEAGVQKVLANAPAGKEMEYVDRFAKELSRASDGVEVRIKPSQFNNVMMRVELDPKDSTHTTSFSVFKQSQGKLTLDPDVSTRKEAEQTQPTDASAKLAAPGTSEPVVEVPPAVAPVEKVAPVDPAAKPKSSFFGLSDLTKGIGDATGTVKDLVLGKAEPTDVLSEEQLAAKKAAETVANASEGIKRANSHESSYLLMLHKGPNKTLEPGDHKNEDGSSYKVDTNGKISEFTTAATKKSPAETYKNIKYDTNGEMISYTSPSQHTFSREKDTNGRYPVDQDGFANWSVKDKNQLQAPYLAAGGAQSWRGKMVMDEAGLHTMIDRTPQGSRVREYEMHTKGMDGTKAESTLQRDRNGLYLQTKVSLADSTEVTRNSRLVRGDTWVRDTNGQSRLQHNDKLLGSGVATVVDAKETETTQIKMDAAGKTGEIIDTTKIGLKLSPEAGEAAEKLLKKISDSPNPVNDLSKAFGNLDNIQSFSMTKDPRGHQNVGVMFKSEKTQKAINAIVDGYQPGPTRIGKDVRFTLTNTAQGFNVDNIQGITGSAHKVKRRGSGPELFSVTQSMHFGKDQNGVGGVTIGSSTLGPLGRRWHDKATTFHAGNFDKGSPMRDIVENPQAMKNVSGALRMFQNTDDIQSVTLKNTGPKAFEVASRGLDAKHIPLNHAIEGKGVVVNSIDLAKDLSASMSADANGTRLSNMKGLTLKITSVLGESNVMPRKVGLETNKDGVPVVALEVEHPAIKGEYLKFEVTVAELKEMRQKKK